MVLVDITETVKQLVLAVQRLCPFKLFSYATT
jgi:hypothetical protein